MKILICDDEMQYTKDLNKHITEYMNNKFIKFTIESETNPVNILNNDTVYDLAFLDILMDSVDGISLAKVLKNRNNKIVLFFLTSFNEYQDDAMNLRAFRFFQKPLQVERLYSGLDKAMEYIDETYVDLFLQEKKMQTRILIDDIMYMENQNRRVILHEKNGTHVIGKKLEALHDTLPQSFFYLVHKSYLVNLHYVDQYNYTELYLNDGTRIPIAPRKQADFRKYWFMYLRRR